MVGRLVFWLKYVRWFLWGNLVLFGFLLPILCSVIFYGRLETYEALNRYYDYIYMSFPIFSVFPALLIHREYLEGRQKELLQGDLCDVFMPAIFMFVICIPFLLAYFYWGLLPESVFELVQEALFISFFFNGISFALNYVFYDTTFTLLVILCYIVLCNSIRAIELIYDWIQPYVFNVLKTKGMESEYYLSYFIVGSICWIIGAYRALKGRELA